MDFDILELDIFLYRNIKCPSMARAATTSDAFNAVAEPRRRLILIHLAQEEQSVGEIVAALGFEQPSVSKHLRVLHDVGLVRVRRNGRHMLYRTNAEAIRPLYEWTKTFERFWGHQLNRIKERAESKSLERLNKGTKTDEEEV
jgi:DNA-binding transcriptional ArsR family regulator